MPYTEEQKRQALIDNGLDPTKYVVDDEGLLQEKPHIPIAAQATETVHQKPASTASGSFIRGAAVSTAPALVGVGATAGTLALLGGGLTATGAGAPVGIPLMLAAGALGAGAAYGAGKLQEKVLPESFKEQLATDAEQHPFAANVGQLVPNLITAKVNSPGNLVRAARGFIPGQIDDAARLAAKDLVLNTGVNVGTGAALRAVEGQPVLDPGGVAFDAAGGALFGAPRNNKLTRALKIYHPEQDSVLRNAVEEAQTNTEPAFKPAEQAPTLRTWDYNIHGGAKELKAASELVSKKLAGQTVDDATRESMLVDASDELRALGKLKAPEDPVAKRLREDLEAQQEADKILEEESKVEAIKAKQEAKAKENILTAEEAALQNSSLEQERLKRESDRVARENLKAEIDAENARLAEEERLVAEQEAQQKQAELEKRRADLEAQKEAVRLRQEAHDAETAREAELAKQMEAGRVKGKLRPGLEQEGRTSESREDAPGLKAREESRRQGLTAGFYNIMKEHFGPAHGITLEKGPAIPGVKGSIKDSEATVTPIATQDTPSHEVFGHGFIDRAEKDPRGKRIVGQLLGEVEKSPDYKRWKNDAEQNPNIDSSPKEYAAQLLGQRLAGDLSGSKYKATGSVDYQFNLLKRELKRIFGKATQDDLEELVQNAFVTGSRMNPVVAKNAQSREDVPEAQTNKLDQSLDDYEATRLEDPSEISRFKAIVNSGHIPRTVSTNILQILAKRGNKLAEKALSKDNKTRRAVLMEFISPEKEAHYYKLREQYEAEATAKQEAAEPKQSRSDAPLVGSTASRIRELGPGGEYLADKGTAAREEQTLLNGKYRNPVAEALAELSPEDQIRADSLVPASSGFIPVHLRKTVNTIRAVLKELHNEQRRNGADVTDYDEKGNSFTRPPKDNPEYNPTIMARDVYDELINRPESAKAKQLRKDFIEFFENEFADAKDPKAKATERLEQMFPRKGGGVGVEYNAVRLAEGHGLPDSWIEKKDIQYKWRKYISKFTADLSYYRHLQKDPVTRRLLNISDDGKGNLDAPKAEATPDGKDISGVNYESNPHVIRMLHDIVGGRQLLPSQLVSTAKLANAVTIGPLGKLRDIATVAPIASEIDGPGTLLRALPSAMANFSEGIRQAKSRGLIDVRQNAWQDNTLNNASDWIDKAADVINKYTGSQMLEQVARGWSWALGKAIADIKLDDPAFVKKFGGKRDANVIADRITEQIQGTYDFRGTPTWIAESAFGPLFSLNRWSIERFNNWKANVYDEAVKGNIKPLLGSALGVFLGSAAVDELNEAIRGKKPEHLTWAEWLNLGGPEAPYKLAAALSTSSSAGVLGDVIFASQQLAQGRKPRGTGMPMLEIASNVSERLGQMVQAESFDIGQLAMVLAKDNIQIIRDLAPVDPKANDRRDVRVIKRLTTGETSPIITTNPFERTEERELREATGPEFKELLPKIVADLRKQFPDNGVFKRRIESLKRSLAHGDNSFVEEVPFWKKLVELRGEEEARRRLKEHLSDKALSQAKANALK